MENMEKGKNKISKNRISKYEKQLDSNIKKEIKENYKLGIEYFEDVEKLKD